MTESSSTSYLCNPAFPEGTNADTHYRLKNVSCAEPCECPVKERPAQRPRGRSYGTVVINDGVYEFKNEIQDDAERRGVARYSDQYVPEIFPKILKSSSDLKSFDMNIFYRDYKYVYHGFSSLATNFQVEYQKKITRISSAKNPLKDVKSYVAEYSDCYEAQKIRKKAIALSRMKTTISGEVFRFGVRDL